MRKESNSMTIRPPELAAVALDTSMLPRRRRAEQLPTEAGEFYQPAYFRVSLEGHKLEGHKNAAHGKAT